MAFLERQQTCKAHLDSAKYKKQEASCKRQRYHMMTTIWQRSRALEIGAVLACIGILGLGIASFQIGGFSVIYTRGLHIGLQSQNAFFAYPNKASIPSMISRTQKSTTDVVRAEGRSNPQKYLRCMINCCGIGDRYKYIYQSYQVSRKLSRHLLIDMAGCPSVGTANVFDYLFPKVQVQEGRGAHILPFIPASRNGGFEKAIDCRNLQKTIKWLHDHNDTYTMDNNTYVNLKTGSASRPRDIVFDPMFNAAMSNMYEGLHPVLRHRVKEYTMNNMFHFERVIGIHLRYGGEHGTVDHAFRRFKRTESFLESFLDKNLRLVIKLAKRLKYFNNFKLYVATDTTSILPRIREKFDQLMISTYKHLENRTKRMHSLLYRPKVFSRDFGKRNAHPLLWANTGKNNGGNRCDIGWYADPLFDNFVLMKADVFVSTVKSGFTYYTEADMLRQGDKHVCYSLHDNLECYRNYTLEFKIK